MTKKGIFSEFPRKRFKTTGKHILALYGLFRGEKEFLFIFVQLYCFEQKGWFTTNPNFPLDLLLFKLVEKNKLSQYFCVHPEIVIFRQIREVFCKLARKRFKTTGKHNLAVCGSFCGEKQFLLIFVPFYCYVQKGLFTTNPNVPLDLPLF